MHRQASPDLDDARTETAAPSPPAQALSRSTLISKEYRDDITKMHHQDDRWGSRGYNWAYLVAGISCIERCRTVLDYGCGKGTLVATLKKSGIIACDFDPGIPEKARTPFPADLVVCTDVLEHVEQDRLNITIEELVRLTVKCLFVVISTRPAGKMLPSGRNAHLTVKSADWWRIRLIDKGFSIRRVWDDSAGKQEFIALLNAPAEKTSGVR